MDGRRRGAVLGRTVVACVDGVSHVVGDRGGECLGECLRGGVGERRGVTAVEGGVLGWGCREGESREEEDGDGELHCELVGWVVG